MTYPNDVLLKFRVKDSQFSMTKFYTFGPIYVLDHWQIPGLIFKRLSYYDVCCETSQIERSICDNQTEAKKLKPLQCNLRTVLYSGVVFYMFTNLIRVHLVCFLALSAQNLSCFRMEWIDWLESFKNWKLTLLSL